MIDLLMDIIFLLLTFIVVFNIAITIREHKKTMKTIDDIKKEVEKHAINKNTKNISKNP